MMCMEISLVEIGNWHLRTVASQDYSGSTSVTTQQCHWISVTPKSKRPSMPRGRLTNVPQVANLPHKAEGRHTV